VILCDTSYLGVTLRAAVRPELVRHWPPDVVARLDRAHLAITPFTLAEERVGRLKAGWGTRRSADAERRLSRFILVPLDLTAVDAYARLRVASDQTGQKFGHHDLWIAAIAISRALPLASCDRTQCAVPGVDAIYLPQHPDEQPAER
jgi:predicted nucleic acid-binding protein